MKSKLYFALILVSTFSFCSTFSGCAGGPKKESTGEYVDDSAITAKIKTEFARDPSVSALDVHVRTFKGTVELSGFVDTAEQKTRAGTIAENTAGVSSVQNKLTVK